MCHFTTSRWSGTIWSCNTFVAVATSCPSTNRVWCKFQLSRIDPARKSCCRQSLMTHTHPFNGPFPGLPRWAGTRKVKPIWILLKQDTMSGSGISWTICRSAPCSRQITTPAHHHSVFYSPDALPVAQPQRQSTEGTRQRLMVTVINQQSTVGSLKYCQLSWSANDGGRVYQALSVWSLGQSFRERYPYFCIFGDTQISF